MAKQASEQMAGELHDMLESLQAQRDGLQREVAELQGHLSQEKSSRSHATDLHHQLEGKQMLRPTSAIFVSEVSESAVAAAYASIDLYLLNCVVFLQISARIGTR